MLPTLYPIYAIPDIGVITPCLLWENTHYNSKRRTDYPPLKVGLTPTLYVMTHPPMIVPPNISIGIIAWNEADAIGASLRSLFQQSLFEKLHQLDWNCEIICAANGCTDRTSSITAEIFGEQSRTHPYRHTFKCQLLDVQERGKQKAWNRFVHQYSARESEMLFLMDADILFHHPQTLWNMFATLQNDAEANVVVDQPLKDIVLKKNPTLVERVSLAASRMMRSSPAQLTGQLYGIRANVARNIYLPRDLVSCEDGFIKSIICTDFLTKPSYAWRIVKAKGAAHVFEAYRSLGDIFKNQKRQIIGQTIVHVLVDKHLKNLPWMQRLSLGETLRKLEATDPVWLKRLIGDHIRATRYFWRLFPNALFFRFQRLKQMKGLKKIAYLPIAILGFFVTMIGCMMVWRFFKQGYIDYWPDTKSARLGPMDPGDQNNQTPHGQISPESRLSQKAGSLMDNLEISQDHQ